MMTAPVIRMSLSNRVEVLSNERNLKATPSCVAFNGNHCLVGFPALDFAALSPTHAIYNTKRVLGRKMDDPVLTNNFALWPFTIVPSKTGKAMHLMPPQDGATSAPKYYLPEQIVATQLSQLKQMAETRLKLTIDSAVFALPALYNSNQRRALQVAARMAGLNVEYQNDSSMAALAYRSLNDVTNKVVMFIDFGAGCLDIAIIHYQQDSIVTLATSGSDHLGGDDIDYQLFLYLVKNIRAKYNVNVTKDKKSTYLLIKECKRVKEQLSMTLETQVDISIDQGGIGRYKKTINRDTLEAYCVSIINDVIENVEYAIEQSGLLKCEIHDIVTLGGASRHLVFKKRLAKLFGARKMKIFNISAPVAYGTALYTKMCNRITIKELTSYEVRVQRHLGSEKCEIVQMASSISRPITISKLEFSPQEGGTSPNSIRIIEKDRKGQEYSSVVKFSCSLEFYKTPKILYEIRVNKNNEVEVAMIGEAKNSCKVTSPDWFDSESILKLCDDFAKWRDGKPEDGDEKRKQEAINTIKSCAGKLTIFIDKE